MKLLFTLLSIFTCFIVSAQAPNILWKQTFGGNGIDQATSIEQTKDSGYIVAGGTNSNDGDVSGNHGGYDGWVIKLSKTNTVQWKFTYGGSGDEWINAIHQTTDSGYIIAGYTTSSTMSGYQGTTDFWIVKLDKNGLVMWQRAMGGTAIDIANAIQQTTSGDYIIAGYSESNDGDLPVYGNAKDYWIVNLNSTGTLINWQKVLGGYSDDDAYDIRQTTDGGYIVAGYSKSFDYDFPLNQGGFDIYVVKLTNTGSVTWKKNLGGSLDDIPRSIIPTSDGGYIMAAGTRSSNGDLANTGTRTSMDYWIVKLRSTGGIQWQKPFGGSGYDLANYAKPLSDGNYIVTGYTESANANGQPTGNQGLADYWILKLNSTGSLLWQKTVGGSASDQAACIDTTSDGGYITAGYTFSNDGDVSGNHGGGDFWIAKLLQQTIRGYVVDAFCNKPDGSLYPSVQKKTLANRATLMLRENGVQKESTQTGADGFFELRQGEAGKTYSVLLTYPTDNQTQIVYEFFNIAYDSLMGEILVPDGLIKELRAFAPKLEKKEFIIESPFREEENIRTVRDGYVMTDFERPIFPFFNLMTENHRKRVDNLANYYLTITTMYRLGVINSELWNESFISVLEFIEALVSLKELHEQLDKKTSVPVSELKEKMIFSSIKVFTEDLFSQINRQLIYISDENKRKYIKKSLAYIKQSFDMVLNVAEKGKKGIGKTIIDIIKESLALEGSAYFYQQFCQKDHENFIPHMARSSSYLESAVPYDQIYPILYDPTNNNTSLIRVANEKLSSTQILSEELRSASKITEAAATFLAAASKIVLFVPPAGPEISLVLQRVSAVSKAIQFGTLAYSIIDAAVAAHDVKNLSDMVIPISGFNNYRLVNSQNTVSRNLNFQQTTVALQTVKNAYNQALLNLKTAFNSPYDSTEYFIRYKEFVNQDSLYTEEMTETFNSLWSPAKNAIISIPSFSNQLNSVMDSLVSTQYTLRKSLYFQNLGYILDSSKQSYIPDLNSLVDKIIVMNDSAVSGISNLINAINSNSISSPAYLVQKSYHLRFSSQPDSTGGITYTFKNAGGETQNNVSFKVSSITAGFSLTSPDSINVGTIAPGETKQINYTFLAPSVDTIGNYFITVNADNGEFNSVTGSLYTRTFGTSLNNGNWSNPATWSNNKVPTSATEVIIKHNVTVDVDASCEAMSVEPSGTIRVSVGKKLSVLK